MKSSAGILVIRVGVFPSTSQTFITLQAKLALELGYDVRILVDKKNGIADTSQAEIIQQYGLLDRTFQLVRIDPAGKWGRLKAIVKIIAKGIPWKLFTTLNYFKYGREGLKGKYLFQYESVRGFIDADIIHIQFGVYKFPFDELKALGVIKGKLITTFHGFDAHYTKSDLADWKLYYKGLFICGSLFTANSNYLGEKLIEMGCPPQRLKIIPMPIDTDYFIPSTCPVENESIHMLSVGRLIKLKGHEFGIHAIHGLRAKGYAIKHTIIGSGEEMNPLKKLIAELGLEDVVTIEGNRTQAEVLQAMRASDIYLMTSTCDASGRREAQGVVVGEAQACGLPIVAFRSGGIPSMICEGETGLLIAENDVEQMIEKLEVLIQDPELRKRMGTAARSFVEKNFSLRSIHRTWEEVYAERKSFSVNKVASDE